MKSKNLETKSLSLCFDAETFSQDVIIEIELPTIMYYSKGQLIMPKTNPRL